MRDSLSKIYPKNLLTIFSARYAFTVFPNSRSCHIPASIVSLSICSIPNTSNRSIFCTLTAARCIALQKHRPELREESKNCGGKKQKVNNR